MKLLTQELLSKFAAVGNQDGKGGQAVVVAKFFHPSSSYTYFATEYIPEDRCFFGWVEGMDEREWGYTSLAEMEALKVRGVGIERDLSFTAAPIAEVLPKEGFEPYPYR